MSNKIDPEDDQPLQNLETYAEYSPAKLKIGQPHPDCVVETASMTNIEPPDIYYSLKIPRSIINKGKLSSLQLEAITYACQQHECWLNSKGERAGFLIGDGTGVGKGRTIAGIVFENFLCGRKKSLWVTVSNEMTGDCKRDLDDVGASKIRVHSLINSKYDKIEHENGVLVCSYLGLIGKNANGTTRLSQILTWLTPSDGSAFSGVIIFDECHKAKNSSSYKGNVPTKTSEVMINLQTLLPNSRIVYSSATGASEIKHMGYLTRLGIWGPQTIFSTFEDFCKRVEKRDIGMMEILSMEMKQRGCFISRQLSFKGVTFEIYEIPVSKEMENVYNRSVILWIKIRKMFQEEIIESKMTNKDQAKVWSQYWGANQRYFRQLCVAAKLRVAVNLAKNAINDGKCVVIGIQSTGEARMEDEMNNNENRPIRDFVSSSTGILRMLVNNSFAQVEKTRTRIMKTSLLKEISVLEPDLPGNALDVMIELLGGPTKVAEMTGRKKRLVKIDRKFVYESRDAEKNNLAEKEKFMSGKKLIAIISEVASCGISLHCDKRVINRKQRVHITLELSWSAEKAVQQFGRTHRSNQECPPIYIILISKLAGENRCASAVAKRLESLGALGHADRRAASNCDFSRFNMDNKLGKNALVRTIRIIDSGDTENSSETISEEIRIQIKKALNEVGILSTDKVSTFLNRIMCLRIDLQNAIFIVFHKTLTCLIDDAKLRGVFNSGIIRLHGQDSDVIDIISQERFLRRHATGISSIILNKMIVDRGMSWEAAKKIYDNSSVETGFYSFNESIGGKTRVILIKAEGSHFLNSTSKGICFVFTPNLGLKHIQTPIQEILCKVHKINLEFASVNWEIQYQHSAINCSHSFLGKKCYEILCSYGKRLKTYHVLSGSLMLCWEDIEDALLANSPENKTQVVKVQTTKGVCFNGVLIPENCLTVLRKRLNSPV